MEMIQYDCTKCGEHLEKEVFNHYDPDNLDSLRKMEHFRIPCHKCGHIMKLYYPSVYHNPQKDLVILFTGAREMENPALEAEKMIGKSTQNMIARICETIEDFVEKVEIMESGLDDRSMELFKLSLFARIHMQDEQLTHVYFYKKNDNGNLEFTLISENGNSGIELPYGAYREIEEIMESESDEVDDGFEIVDRNWAGLKIKKETGRS